MKPYQTPNSGHSRQGSLRVQRQPLAVISNCPEFSQCANYLQQKVQGLEQRVKNLNSQHADRTENRSTTTQKNEASLSPFVRQKKQCSSNQKVDSQSYYETIINKRLENISKIDQSPVHIKTDNTMAQQDKYSMHSQFSNLGPQQGQLHTNSIVRIQQLTKKLRKFKMIKDQNQDECAPSLAKIKCFCQEYYNDCFDFYRCTDLIALKYFIYLLIQEVNSLYSQDAFKMADNSMQYQQQIEMLKEQLDNQKNDQMSFQNQLKLQKMVVDTQKLIQDIINVLQTKHNQSTLINQVEVLNNQMKNIKENMSSNQLQHQHQNQNATSFGQQLAKCGIDVNYKQRVTNDTSIVNQSNFKTQTADERNITQFSSKSKSPYSRNQKNHNFDLEQQIELNKKLFDEQVVTNRQLMEKLFKLQTEKQQNDQILKQVQDELKQKNQIIIDLENNLQKENQILNKINQNLEEAVYQNKELQKENNNYKENIDQSKKIEQKYYDLLQQNNNQLEQLNQVVKENGNLQKIQQQIEAEYKGYQQQILKLQEKCQAQYAQLQDQSDTKYLQQQINELLLQQQEQSKIITLITDEALYLGQMTLYASDILSRQPIDGIPTTLVMLQKDLNGKRSTIQQKMNILQQFGNNMRNQPLIAHSSSNQFNDNVDLLENLHSEASSIRQKNVSSYEETASTIHNNNIQSNDLMVMLLVQCNTLEKMMEL
ncbi:unnamed protein product [Paramecium primaurelia]|uniref:Uncharacterized protein n=1 Tax=Paramecium primaurelia TaxID=5886 RepID=A0A8S1P5C4_PARPR|nr:unnamed protein product [Paramecium primaurelia]